MSELSRKKAIIKRAQALALKEYFALDLSALAELQSYYESSLEEVISILLFYADSIGTIRLQQLSALRTDIERALNNLASLQTELLNRSLLASANIGVKPFLSHSAAASALDIAQRTTRFVKQFTGEDGLQLSDRLWIINDNNKNKVLRAINSAVIQGHSASEAAASLVANNELPTKEIKNKVNNASAEKIGNVLKAQGKDEDAAYWQARRLFRTEINRAHGMAYQNSLEEDEDIIGTRFMLSPNHPRVDICDMHASVNRFGLGRGVYPKGKNPWPAHPNTLSYVEAVFTDEVTDEDRATKQDRIEWLSNQSGNIRIGVLGVYKNNLLQNDLLKETMIRSKVRTLKNRFG